MKKPVPFEVMANEMRRIVFGLANEPLLRKAQWGFLKDMIDSGTTPI